MQGTGGFLHPEKVLSQAGVAAGMRVADFGCGHGYFAIPAARLVGNNGEIFAVDVLNEALDAVRAQTQEQGIVNIKTQRGNLEAPAGSKLPEASMDMVLLHNVLFESQKKGNIIKEAKRVLRSSGAFHLIDWLPSVDLLLPPKGWRVEPEEAKKLAEQEGFVFKNSFDAGEYHYGLTFIKP